MAGPLVDIGIPVYQRAEYVAQAIESVLAQSYGDWRLTVSEDGPPTDAIRDAVEPYLADERVRYVTTGRRLGLARNKSSLAAGGHGKYVALLDDDDVWLAGWLAQRIDFLETQRRVRAGVGRPSRHRSGPGPSLHDRRFRSTAACIHRVNSCRR